VVEYTNVAQTSPGIRRDLPTFHRRVALSLKVLQLAGFLQRNGLS